MRDSREPTPANASPQAGQDAGLPAGTFAVQLRAARRERGWSQQFVAEAMKGRGFSWRQTTVAKTEAGDRPVLLGEAVALAEIFKKNIEYFLESQDALDTVIEETAESLGVQRQRLLQLESQAAEAKYRLLYEEATYAVAVAIKGYRVSYDSGPLMHEMEEAVRKFHGYAIASNAAYDAIGVRPAELQAIDGEALREAAEAIMAASKYLNRERMDPGGYAVMDAAAEYLSTGRENLHLYEALRSFGTWIDIACRRVVDLIVERVGLMPS